MSTSGLNTAEQRWQMAAQDRAEMRNVDRIYVSQRTTRHKSSISSTFISESRSRSKIYLLQMTVIFSHPVYEILTTPRSILSSIFVDRSNFFYKKDNLIPVLIVALTM